MRPFRAALAAAVTAAIVLMTVTGSSADTAWSLINSGPGRCLTAVHPRLGALVQLRECNPPDLPYQLWNFQTAYAGTAEVGTVQLAGTSLWLVPSSTGLRLGTSAQAGQFTYVNHALAALGRWLVHYPGTSPYLARGLPPRHGRWTIVRQVP